MNLWCASPPCNEEVAANALRELLLKGLAHEAWDDKALVRLASLLLRGKCAKPNDELLSWLEKSIANGKALVDDFRSIADFSKDENPDEGRPRLMFRNRRMQRQFSCPLRDSSPIEISSRNFP